MSEIDESKKTLISHFEPMHATLSTYVVGFVSCIVLTIAAYVVATSHSVGNDLAVGVIAALALVQFVVQLLAFLHLGREFAPRWKLLAFVSMLCIVLIIVAGSVWIMNNLNYRMMSSTKQTDHYVESQDGL